MSQVYYPFQVFQTDLKRAEDLLKLVKAFRSFAGSQLPSDNIGRQWHEALELHQLAPGLRTDLPVLSGSILLYVCGRFEFFVREVVTAIADEIVDRASDYSSLEDSFRKQIFDRTLSVAKSPAKYGYSRSDAERLVSELGANLSNSNTPFSIETSVLTITDSNMNANMLAEIFKRVAVDKIWEEIGKQAKLKLLLGSQTDGECMQKARSRLDMIMQERNSLTHPTESTHFPDPDAVLDSCEFLGIVASVLVDIAQIRQS